jgi:hypothetical protein
VNKRSILVPLGVALAAAFPQGAQAKALDAGLGVGRAQAAVTRTAGPAAGVALSPLLALPNGSAVAKASGHYSHTSHQSHHSHYSSSGGGHYSHSSHTSHSSHYSSS